ncbi:MAG TPA: AMP-binding protein, partial [Burkholderiaceae bacterium]|nr:AMP-binding protein [Burkholderiaceae bacterium]
MNASDYMNPGLLRTEEDIRRFERVPLEERGLPRSTYQMLMDGCAIDPSKTAIHEFSDGSRPMATDRRTTYAELRAKVNQTANLLFDLGVGKDDVVSVLMPAVTESQFVLWGAQAAGIVNPVNWMLEPEILVQMFRAAATKVLVVYGGDEHAQPWPKLEAVVPQLPSLRAVVRAGGQRPCPAAIGDVEVVDFGASLDRYPADRLVSGRVFDPDDTASLFHTGGTTGAPKLARHLHRNQVFWIWASKYLSGPGAEEVRLIGVPIFHVAGAIVGCYGPLTRGAIIVLMTSAGYRHPTVVPNLWRIVEAFRASTVTFVPTLVNQLLSIPVDGADLSSVSYAACSTAPLSTAAAEAFFAMTGLRIRESYGMTETMAVTFITPSTDRPKVGSSGLRIPYQQARIVELDPHGRIRRDCGPGEPGLVL